MVLLHLLTCCNLVAQMCQGSPSRVHCHWVAKDLVEEDLAVIVSKLFNDLLELSHHVSAELLKLLLGDEAERAGRVLHDGQFDVIDLLEIEVVFPQMMPKYFR